MVASPARQIATALLEKTPKSYLAMQYLVMAVEDWYKVRNKTSWLGKPKDVPALEKVLLRITKMLGAMWNEQIITDKSLAPADLMDNIRRHFSVFFLAYPNWPVAHAFVDSDVFPEMVEHIVKSFGGELSDAAIIEETQQPACPTERLPNLRPNERPGVIRQVSIAPPASESPEKQQLLDRARSATINNLNSKRNGHTAQSSVTQSIAGCFTKADPRAPRNPKTINWTAVFVVLWVLAFVVFMWATK